VAVGGAAGDAGDVLKDVLIHPLFIGIVQVILGGVAAYFLTERWQRWRQRREFQYRTMSKFSEISMEIFVLSGELLSIRPLQQMMADAWDDKQRRYISQRVLFHALEADIMACFSGEILRRYYELNRKGKALFDLVQSTGHFDKMAYEPIQDAFLNGRKDLLGNMIAEMKLLSWWERRRRQCPNLA